MKYIEGIIAVLVVLALLAGLSYLLSVFFLFPFLQVFGIVVGLFVVASLVMMAIYRFF